MYLLVVGVLFTFTACVEETESCATDCAKECCIATECADDCAKACCLGCLATEGERKCIKLEDGTMPCCVEKECAADCDKECCAAAACCCGDATCDGSCHEEEEEGDWEPPGGNMERYMDLKDEGKSHEEAVEIMEEEF